MCLHERTSATSSANGHRLSKHPLIGARVAELRTHAARRHDVTMNSLLHELEIARSAPMQQCQYVAVARRTR